MRAAGASRISWRTSAMGVLLTLLLAPVVCHAADSGPQGPDFNVLLISIDTLSADHLSCYGYSRKTSPNLDQLAAQGVLFENVTAASSSTIPSHMSMFTSLYPSTHGVLGASSLGDAVPTLAQVLSRHGYATAGFVTPMLNHQEGFGRGFQLYDDTTVSQRHPGLDSEVTNDTISELGIRWLRENGREKKFLLFLHYWDCHSDYIPPAPYDRKFDPLYEGKENGKDFKNRRDQLEKRISRTDLAHLVALYDGEVAHTDDDIGELLRVLDDMKLADKTLVVVTSDHGEGVMEHGQLWHDNSLFEELIHVPLILRLPNVLPQSLRLSGNTSHVDLMPTVLGLLHIPEPSTLQGTDLSAICRGETKSFPDRILFSELGHGEIALRAARWNEYKLIHGFYGHYPAPKSLLLVSGGSERDARKAGLGAKQRQEIEDRLNKALSAGPAISREPDQMAKPDTDQKTLELLRSLGYMQ